MNAVEEKAIFEQTIFKCAEICEAKKMEFCRIFNITPEIANSLLSKFVPAGIFGVDIFKLEDWLEANKGYNHYGSMKCFIQKTYGDEAVKFILENLY